MKGNEGYLLGPQTGTLDTVAVGWTTLATELIIGAPAAGGGGEILPSAWAVPGWPHAPNFGGVSGTAPRNRVTYCTIWDIRPPLQFSRGLRSSGLLHCTL